MLINALTAPSIGVTSIIVIGAAAAVPATSFTIYTVPIGAAGKLTVDGATRFTPIK